MHLSVKGKQLDVGEALRNHVRDSLNNVVAKYFGSPMEANVVFSREAHLYRSDISVHVGRGIMLQSNGEADTPYPAFDGAIDKIAKRLRRYKRRLRNHRVDGPDLDTLEASQYILRPEQDEPAETADASGDEDAGQPVIVAEMTTIVDTLTVSEAVMRMDLADLPALLFRNRGHGGLNMVYRRPDGNVGWVDPK